MRRLLAGVVACLVLAGIVGVAVVADARDDRGGASSVQAEAGPDDAGEDGLLDEVCRFVTEKRTARFTRTSEWSFDEGDGEPLQPERSTAKGEMRLPGEAHAVEQYEDGSFEEAVVHLEDRFMRRADSRPELGGALWEDESDRAPEPDDDAGVLAEIVDHGLPVRLDVLLGKLRRAQRLGEGRVLGRYEIAELEGGAPVPPIDTGRATVEVRFSKGGRLDELTLDVVEQYAGETTHQRHVYRFTDWGAPVAFTLPDRSAVAERSRDDEGLDATERALAQRITVYAPTVVPDSWDMHDWSSSTAGDEVAVCGYFTLEFGPAPGQTQLAVASASTGTCDVAPIRPEQLAGAMPITIADKQGWLLRDVAVEFTELSARMIVVDIGTTRVVAVTNESQQFLESVIRGLVPAEPIDDDVQPA